MKPKQRLKEMQASLYDIITNQTNYSWTADEKDGAIIETPLGQTKIFLHYRRDGLNTLKHQVDMNLFNMQNTSNLFYGDGENFLCSEKNVLLENTRYKGTRNYLSRKEQFILKSQKDAQTEKERLAAKTNLVVGRYSKLSPADYLSYIVAQEFDGGIRTYAMRPILLKYGWITPENPKYNFVKEGFAETRFISQPFVSFLDLAG